MSAAALAILPELGPPGWVALGVIGVGAAAWGGYEWYQSRSHAAATTDANTRADAQTDTATDTACRTCCARLVVISRTASPQAAQHIADAQVAGHPSVLTLDRLGTDARRSAALSGIPTVPGMHRDEYPPATFAEGGAGASVRSIPARDNESAGGQLRAQMNRPTRATEGCKITITVGP